MKLKLTYSEALLRAKANKTYHCKCGRVLNAKDNLEEMALILMFGGPCFECSKK